MRTSSFPYVAPFLSFLLFLYLEGRLGLSPGIEYPLRVFLLTVILWVVSRHVIDLRVTNWAGSVFIGVLVFVIWIAPDTLFPAYRESWLFRNSLLGNAPVPVSGYANLPFAALVFRVIRAVLLVPIIEELFWRAWLMRWIAKPDFLSVPLGFYSAQAFWITAALFALEHGSYWDVGLAAGVLYNWWMVRTRSLGDCILAHAITNALLSGYVLHYGKWQYW